MAKMKPPRLRMKTESDLGHVPAKVGQGPARVGHVPIVQHILEVIGRRALLRKTIRFFFSLWLRLLLHYHHVFKFVILKGTT
jgi:hypothetical protein